MNSGYIYIIKNLAFKEDILKIGRTSRSPSARSNEIYHNSTGVPEPFVLVFYRKTCNQYISEEKIHSLLSNYRHNNRREFFVINIESAKKAINLCCDDTELKFGNAIPDENQVCFDVDLNMYKESHTTIIEPDFSDIETSGFMVDIKDLEMMPPGQSTLSKDQEFRITVLSKVFENVFPYSPDWVSSEKWIEDFTRDSNPEREIILWESMAKAFNRFTSREHLSQDEITECFNYINIRSGSSRNNAKNNFERKYLNDRKFKFLESCCRWQGQPMAIEKL
jgi:hypothetical protein